MIFFIGLITLLMMNHCTQGMELAIDPKNHNSDHVAISIDTANTMKTIATVTDWTTLPNTYTIAPKALFESVHLISDTPLYVIEEWGVNYFETMSQHNYEKYKTVVTEIFHDLRSKRTTTNLDHLLKATLQTVANEREEISQKSIADNTSLTNPTNITIGSGALTLIFIIASIASLLSHHTCH